MSETVMGETINDTFVNYTCERLASMITNNIREEIIKERNKKNRKRIGLYCSYNLALVLFFYGIEEEFVNEHYYEIDISNYDDPDTYIPHDKSRYFPVFTVHEAKYFLRTCMDIDIIERPIIVNKEKMYAADIWVSGKLIKHKKWSYMFFRTPEEVFEEAVLYILLDKELDKIKKPAVMIGKKNWGDAQYTLYVNNLDRYYHMIEYTKVEELKEIYDLPINKYKKISYSYELQRRKIKHNRSSV